MLKCPIMRENILGEKGDEGLLGVITLENIRFCSRPMHKNL